MKHTVLRLVGSLVLIGAGAGVARASEPLPAPYVYITPSAGIWRWDQQPALGVEYDGRSGFTWGGRVGAAPIDAFAGELVILTGTNDLALTPAPVPVRQTLVEFSLIVNFQTLLNSPVYPFLGVGLGGSFRSSDAVNTAGDPIADGNDLAFHIGGGLKWDLEPRAALRLNIRDTFFTETQELGNRREEVTVDTIEFTLGLEYRIPLSRSRGGSRLR